MKVALYHNLPSGGALRVIEAYAREMHTAHQLELFLPSTAAAGFVDLERYVSQVRRFPVEESDTKLGRYRQVLGAPRYGRQIAAAIDAGGFDVVFAHASALTQAPEILPYLRTQALYYCPEHLRAIYDRPESAAPLTLKQQLKAAFFWPYDQRRKAFDRRAIRAADRVMTHSAFTRDILRQTYDITADVIHLGVDSELFHPQGRDRSQPPFVISVGALHPLKGHQFVIESLATIPPANRPSLVVVGDRGDYAATLQRLAAELQVSLELKQKISTEELVRLYNEATVMAAAQYREPFGLITLEAMACQTPVAAVAEGGLKETVKDGQTGLLVPRDADQFGHAIARICGDPALARSLGQAGRADVTANWQWPTTVQRIDALLQETARGGSMETV